MVSQDLDGKLTTFDVVSLLLKRSYDGEQLLVICLVVFFCRDYFPRLESDRMLISVVK